MNRPYVIFVDGVKAKMRKSFPFALKDKYDLEAKGYKNVSIAYEPKNLKGD